MRRGHSSSVSSSSSSLLFSIFSIALSCAALCIDVGAMAAALPPDEVIRNTGDRIVMAQVIFRHGGNTYDNSPNRAKYILNIFLERAPNAVCSTDAYQESLWPGGFEELTPKGLNQQYALGKRLRERYVNTHALVSPTFNSKQIYVRSSDVNRTLVSAIANAAGFYSADDDKRAYLAPVPVHSVDRDEDYLRPADGRRSCPGRQKMLIGMLKQTTEYDRLLQNHKPVLEQISNFCGETTSFFQGDARLNTGLLSGYFEILELNNMSLPEWVSPSLRDTIEILSHTELAWKNGYGTPKFHDIDLSAELSRVRGGPLLWTIIDTMQRKRDCVIQLAQNQKKGKCQEWAKERRLIEYSAHDTTLAAILPTLGLPTNVDRSGYVPFASALMIELWQKQSNNTATIEAKKIENNDIDSEQPEQELMKQHKTAINADDFYVKVLFWTGISSNYKETRPVEMDLSENIEGCGGEGCTLDQFVSRSNRYSPIQINDPICTDPTDLRDYLDKKGLLQMMTENGERNSNETSSSVVDYTQ